MNEIEPVDELEEYLKKVDKYNKDKIIELFAEGNSVNEILELASSDGVDLTDSYLHKIRQSSRDTINEITYAKSKELLKKVPRANKFIRVRNINSIIEKMENIINTDLDNNILNRTTINGIDIILKAYRQIAEETNDIGPVVNTGNNYIQIIQNLPPDQRASLISRAKELQQLVQASADGVIDVEFKEEKNETG